MLLNGTYGPVLCQVKNKIKKCIKKVLFDRQTIIKWVNTKLALLN